MANICHYSVILFLLDFGNFLFLRILLSLSELNTKIIGFYSLFGWAYKIILSVMPSMINMEGRTMLTFQSLLIAINMQILLLCLMTPSQPTKSSLLVVFNFVSQSLIFNFKLAYHKFRILQQLEPLIFRLLELRFDSIDVESKLLFHLSNKSIVTPICLRI